jgi:adenine-specific DNA-methyltransferase
VETDDGDNDDIGIQVAGSYFYRSGLQASNVLRQIFGKKVFDNPKDHEVLMRWINYVTFGDKKSLILGCTAGSGTTAHAVLALNEEDKGNRQFILCQMPYETKEQERKKENICESITAERVRRVIKGVPRAKDEKLRNGFGGTFSYFKLGKELRKQAILDGKDLPSYAALAGFVFFTATGEEFQPKKMKPPFIGTSRDRDVFLIYEEDIEQLKDMALNLELARKLGKSERKKLVFAPTKYLDQEYLDRLNIEFCQLPFEIYQRATKK